MATRAIILLLAIYCNIRLMQAESRTPIVLWHGMGDSCCNPLSMGSVIRSLQSQIPGVYVKSLKLGENIASDMERGFFANMNELVEMACNDIANDSNLANGYNAVGFSQGAQFLRAVAERCPTPRMKNLVSVGGQHQGIFGLPYCIGDNVVCDTVRTLLEAGAYLPFVQKRVVQAQYWHDPTNEEEYREKNIFLADINNEKQFNASYKANLLKLDNLVLIMFTKDHMVVPKESSWFGFYEPGNISRVLNYNETRLYTEDLLGLADLERTSRLHFDTVEGDHLQFQKGDFDKKIIPWLLK